MPGTICTRWVKLCSHIAAWEYFGLEQENEQVLCCKACIFVCKNAQLCLQILCLGSWLPGGGILSTVPTLDWVWRVHQGAG